MSSKAKPAPTPKDWDHDALLAKAQRYMEAMLEIPRDDWRFGLWSTLALELLARAALAKVSPTLLAEPGNWNNLFHALGHTPTAKKFIPKSITITDVLTRLREIHPQFDAELEGFCAVHIGKRNTELHSGETRFDDAKNSSWLPMFYRASAVLLETVGSDLTHFAGADEAKTAAKLMAAAADQTAKAVAGTISAYKKVWDAREVAERKSLAEQAALWATKRVGHRVICPACGSTSLVTGEPFSAPQKTFKDDLIVEVQQYLPSKFECVACGMKISGLSHLSAAGVGDAYKQTRTYDPAEYYAPPESDDEPDEEQEYEPDFND